MMSCPAVVLVRNMINNLSKNLLERVQPQTKADSELQLKFDCPAPYFVNANVSCRAIVTS